MAVKLALTPRLFHFLLRRHREGRKALGLKRVLPRTPTFLQKLRPSFHRDALFLSREAAKDAAHIFARRAKEVGLHDAIKESVLTAAEHLSPPIAGIPAHTTYALGEAMLDTFKERRLAAKMTPFKPLRRAIINTRATTRRVMHSPLTPKIAGGAAIGGVGFGLGSHYGWKKR